jgi:DNA-binding response OmpR family regulator
LLHQTLPLPFFPYQNNSTAGWGESVVWRRWMTLYVDFSGNVQLIVERADKIWYHLPTEEGSDMDGDRKRYKVLILEDDPHYAEPLRMQIQSDDQFELLGVTGRASEAYQLLKAGLPDVVIVDLQLDEGDGYGFLQQIRDPNENLALIPYVLVTTMFASDMTMSILTSKYADHVIKKHNESYSPELVLRHLHIASSQFDRNSISKGQQIVSALDLKERLRMRFERELDRYTIQQTMDGKAHLIELLYLAYQLPHHVPLRVEELYAEVGKPHQKTGDAVSAAIRRVLDYAFLRTDPDELARLYRPNLDAQKGGRPENKEFITVVVDKIRKENII